MKKSIQAALCGLAAALCVTFMFLGGIFYIFAYTVPILLGLVTVMIKKTFGNASAVSVYIAVSILSLMLVPEKETVMMYVLFFGYYPIIKSYLDRVKPKIISLFFKLITFNTAVAIIELICVYVFGIPFFVVGDFSKAMLIIFAAAMNTIFIIYEYLLKYFVLLYERKVEKRLKNILR